MLRWAFFFLTVAAVAAVFGFWGIPSREALISKVISVVFFVLFVIAVAVLLLRRGGR